MKRSAGFTLLETLVALLVLSLIVVGLAQGLRFGLSAWDHQAATIDRDGALDATDRTLRTLLARIQPGRDPGQPAISGGADRLSVTTELPLAAPARPVRLADIVLGVDARHRLVMRWTPHLHARLLAPLPTQEAVLLPGVAAVTFAYFRADTGVWRSSYGGADAPALVRVHLTFSNAALHWPDVIVAPMVQRPADS